MQQHHHIHRVHKEQPKDALDILIYFFTIATPLFELPQAIAIYNSKSADNVSIWTWGFFLVADVAWLSYAWRHKIIPIFVMYLCYLMVEASIVVGILLYS